MQDLSRQKTNKLSHMKVSFRKCFSNTIFPKTITLQHLILEH